MQSEFGAVAEEFGVELETIGELVGTAQRHSTKPQVRVAAANSSMLLLAATFEEFIRDMALLSLRRMIDTARDISNIPTPTLRAAWTRTFDDLTKVRLPQSGDHRRMVAAVEEARRRTGALFDFLEGDVGQDIHADLIRNDSGMRAEQINRLFRLSGVNDVCRRIAGDSDVQEYLRADSLEMAASELIQRIDAFVARRNEVAHQLNQLTSVAAKDIRDSIDTLYVFSEGLCGVLDSAHGIDGA